jgi:hypothetical protein
VNVLMFPKLFVRTLCVVAATACIVISVIAPKQTANALVPVVQKAIHTSAVLIYWHFQQNSADTQLVIVKELALPLVRILQTKYKPLFDQMERIIKNNKCTNVQTKLVKTKSEQTQKQLQTDACLFALFNKLINIFVNNPAVQKDVLAYFTAHKTYWDGVFYVPCSPKLIGTLDPSCFPSFLGSPIQTPTGGVQSNVHSGSPFEDNARPYRPSEQSVCMRKINDIRDCIDDTLDRIRITKKDIQQLLRKNIPTETKQSLREIEQMIADFDKELTHIETDLSTIEDVELIRTTTSDMHQQALHAYLDILRNRVSLLSAIVLIEKSVLPRNSAAISTSFVQRNKSVLRKLKEMSVGVFSLYRQLVKSPRISDVQKTCIEKLLILLSQLRTSTSSVQNALDSLLKNPSPNAIKAYNATASSAINTGIAVMQRYEQLRPQCTVK